MWKGQSTRAKYGPKSAGIGQESAGRVVKDLGVHGRIVRGSVDLDHRVVAAPGVHDQPARGQSTSLFACTIGVAAKKCGNIFRVGIFLDFVSSSTRTPRWGCIVRADERTKPN